MAQLTDSRILGARHPAVGVPRGVADEIRFSFDNTAVGQALSSLPHQYPADEVTSERDHIDLQLAQGSGGWPFLCRQGFSASARPTERAKAPAQTDRRSIGSRGPPSPL
jgi:hypothetical protein